jgi:sodium-dependent dicarboxylate transporter 2/3/5
MPAIALHSEPQPAPQGFVPAVSGLVAILRAKPAGLLAAALVVAVELFGSSLETEARRALQIFALALVGWTLTRLDDAFVAFAAALAMAVLALDEPDEMFDALGNELIWLLIASFMLAAAIRAAGLADRLARFAVARARTTRGAFHALTAAMIATAFLVPSTSGRAALMAPVYEAVARTAGPELRKAFALLFPTVILLSAIASITGAGAHVLAAELLDEVSDVEIGFLQWALYGLPFAAASSFLAAEVVLRMFAPRAGRAACFSPPAAAPAGNLRPAAPLVAIGAAVIAGWASKPLHGLEDTLVALMGACAAVAPSLGGIGFKRAVEAVEWRLVLFMAATVVIAEGLTDSGLVKALVEGAFAPLGALGAPPMVWLLAIAALGLVSHLIIHSRTARIAILLPPTLAAAEAATVDPLAAAFTLVAATGFCQLLRVSAKPVALFGALPGRPFEQADLVRLGAALAPMLLGLIAVFAAVVWPLLGLPTAD